MCEPGEGIWSDAMSETLVDADVTYTLEYSGEIHIFEHVPAEYRRRLVSGFPRPVLASESVL
jgi:hypothetical protein